MTGRQEDFQRALNAGHSAAWDGLWDQAAGHYRRALDESPDHPQALANLGLALYELQEYEEALRVYQRAARISPQDPVPVEKVAQLCERLGNLRVASQASQHAAELYLKNLDAGKAVENWQRVARLEPENLQAHARLALVFGRTGEKAKAVSEYLALASLVQSGGDPDRADQAVSQALQLMPGHPEALQAQALLREGRPLPRPTRARGGTAPLRMSQVRRLEPDSEMAEPRQDPVTQARQAALTALAGMLFDSAEENPEDTGSRRAVQGLSSLVRGKGGPHRPTDRSRIILHLSQVVDLQTGGQNAQAAEELERALEAGLEHPAASFDLGYLWAVLGQDDSALRHLKAAVKGADFTLASRLLIGQVLQRSGRNRDAAIEYLEALRLADSQVVPPAQAEDLRQLYEPLIEAQRRQEAEALSRLCDNIRDLLLRSDWKERLAHARQQLPSRADGPLVPLAEILTEARSSQVVDSIAVMYALAERGSLRSAMEEAFYTLEQAPTYLPLHTYMGELLLKQDRLPEAIAKFLMVARAYNIRGETPKAVEMYRRILDLAPMDLKARTLLIEQLTASGQSEAAIREVLSLAEVYYDQADLEMTRKTLAEALRLAQAPRVNRDLRLAVLHRLADIDVQSLDWRQALRIYEQIRTLQPDDEKARLNLIDLNFRLGQETAAIAEVDNTLSHYLQRGGGEQKTGGRQRALHFLEHLVKENSDRLGLRHRLAELYRQCGRQAEAIETLDSLGEALLEKGDRAAAAQVIKAILALNPPNQKDYLQLLQQLK